MTAVDQHKQAREQHAYRWQVQANTINQVLGHHGVASETLHGQASREGSQFTFRAQIASGMDRLRQLAGDLTQALLVDDVSVGQEGDLLQVRVPRSAEVAVPMLPLLNQVGTTPAYTAVLGLAETGEVVMHDFADRAVPHLLVCGGERAGKTALLRSAAVSIALANRQAGVQMLAMSPIRSDREQQARQESAWKPLDYLPHMLSDVAFRQSEIRDLLIFLVGEMSYREEQGFGQPRIVVFLDQLDMILQRNGAEAKQAIHKLLQRGDDVGIHIMASLNPTGLAELGPHLQSALRVRVSGRTEAADSLTSPRTASNDTLKALLGEGDFVIQSAGKEKRFQAAFVDDYDLHLVLNALYTPRKRLLAGQRSVRVELPRQESHEVQSMQFVNQSATMMAAD